MSDNEFNKESKIFEKLYKYDKNGNIKEWSIWMNTRIPLLLNF